MIKLKTSKGVATISAKSGMTEQIYSQLFLSRFYLDYYRYFASICSIMEFYLSDVAKSSRFTINMTINLDLIWFGLSAN